MTKVVNDYYGNLRFWRQRFTCSGGLNQNILPPCHSLIEIKATDIVKRASFFKDKAEILYGFNCPKCGCFTVIEDSKLPDYVIDNVKYY